MPMYRRAKGDSGLIHYGPVIASLQAANKNKDKGRNKNGAKH
jgi:hypothetical protein